MPYFAELDDENKVTNIIVCETIEWCKRYISSNTWVETFHSTQGKNYAGIGMLYDPVCDNFINKQPFPSWTLDGNCIWQAPVMKPTTHTPSGIWEWDEENQKWEDFNVLISRNSTE
jgi:hypothetical protein